MSTVFSRTTDFQGSLIYSEFIDSLSYLLVWSIYSGGNFKRLLFHILLVAKYWLVICRMDGSPLVERTLFSSLRTFQSRLTRTHHRTCSNGGDRFIPHRRTSSINEGYHNQMKENSEVFTSQSEGCRSSDRTPNTDAKRRVSHPHLLQNEDRILNFSPLARRKSSSGIVQFIISNFIIVQFRVTIMVSFYWEGGNWTSHFCHNSHDPLSKWCAF